MRNVPTTLALVAAAAVLAPAAAVAQVPSGEDTQIGLTSSIGPPISTPGGPSRSMALAVGTTFRAPDEAFRPQTLVKAEIFFSNGAVVNSKLFPGCKLAKLVKARGRRSACPAASHIGSGTARGKAGDTSTPLIQPLSVDVYVGQPGRNLIFFLKSSVPININMPIVAPLVRVKSRFYGYKLTLKVPELLQLPLPGVPASVTDFNVTVKGTVTRGKGRKRKKRGFVETSLCPPGAQVPIRGIFTFRDGAVQTIDSGIVCGGKLPS
jgi:hypothetical protein